MKKVLFATSALVAFAGAAAAEVAVTGDALLGLRYDSDIAYQKADGTAGTRGAWNVVNRARVTFTMTGQSDSGLEFGAKVRADYAGKAKTDLNGSMTRGSVWVSGTYGKLTAGDIDAAIVQAVGHLPYIGVSELDDLNEFWYSTSDLEDFYDQSGLIYEYAINGVKVYASFMDQNSGQSADRNVKHSYSLGAAYEMNGWQLGAGWERGDKYQEPITGKYSNNANGTFAISASGAFAETKVTGIFSRTKVQVAGNDNDFKVDQFGLGAEYKLANGVGLAGYYKHVKNESVGAFGKDVNDGKADILGLGASYDLGGGATVKGGIVNVSGKDGYKPEDRTMADFGLSFKF